MSKAAKQLYVRFPVTEEESRELGRAAEISKIAIASIAKSGAFKQARELVKGQEVAGA